MCVQFFMLSFGGAARLIGRLLCYVKASSTGLSFILEMGVVSGLSSFSQKDSKISKFPKKYSFKSTITGFLDMRM